MKRRPIASFIQANLSRRCQASVGPRTDTCREIHAFTYRHLGSGAFVGMQHDLESACPENF